MNFTPQSAMQRIQVGLIGIVAVLLFVSIANMLFERPGVQDGDPQQTAVKAGPQAAAENRDEPLAELGVAPAVSEQPPQAKQPVAKSGGQ